MCFVADFHLGAIPPDQFIDGPTLGGTHVRGGEDAELHAAVTELFEGRFEEAKPRPSDEGIEQVHGIGGLDLGAELRCEVGIILAVGQEGGVAEPCCGAAELPTLERVPTMERVELSGALENGVRAIELLQ